MHLNDRRSHLFEDLCIVSYAHVTTFSVCSLLMIACKFVLELWSLQVSYSNLGIIQHLLHLDLEACSFINDIIILEWLEFSYQIFRF
ncbi:hypothetical protein KFK09_000247 [Dendrobium nobile]|uniref:Uncharacterized protein n=1 Tax=Dendrobium nobile TaxID=94219 RepID=A0A8T3CDE2_DENNO|nr:hypothetical protein KFK09_000247 [Dendrobium nobile]